jgi:hypothetical protein
MKGLKNSGFGEHGRSHVGRVAATGESFPYL